MASTKESQRKLVKKVDFAYLQRLSSGVSLVTLFVVILAGIINDVRWTTITFRACLAIVVIMIITKFVVRILASYEEIHGGKA